MALYRTTGPDGNVYEIEGPEGATPEQVAAAVRRRILQDRPARLREELAALQSRPPAPPERTFGGNVKEAFKGFIPGAVGLLESAGTGISALLPDDTEKSARETIKGVAGAIKKPFEAAPGYEDAPGRKIGEGLGSILPAVPLAFMGPVGVGAGVGMGLAAGAGEARERAEREKASGSERSTATALGMIPGGFDAAIDMALAAFPGGSGKALGFIRRALISGGVEGATEAAQAVAQNAIAKGVYKPDQSLVEGAAEEGAYGAGVGALASVLLDAAIPGRRKGAATKPSAEPPAPAATTPPAADQQKLLGYSKEPFTPVAMPDGSVITSREDYDAYIRTQDRDARQREEDKRTSDPMANVPEDQRNLARRGKEAALAETFAGTQEPGQLDLPGMERADGTVEVPGRGRVTPGVVETPEPDVEPMTAREADTQTRDMIDEDEQLQIEELLSKPTGDQEKDRLKMRSDIETLGAQLADKQQKTTEEERLALLLPILEGNRVYSYAFREALQDNGFTDLNFTEREQRLMQKATDMRFAEAPAPEPVSLAPSAPAENQSMEALIPERKETRTPEQPSFPGMGKPKGAAPAAFSEEELQGQADRDTRAATPRMVITPQVLTAVGLTPQSSFYQRFLNLDLSKPEDQIKARDALAAVRMSSTVSPKTKQAIERVAMFAFQSLAKQQEMFGPRGGVITPEGGKNAPSGGGKRAADTGNQPGGAGAGPAGGAPSAAQNKPAGANTDTERTQATQPAGLGDRGQSAGSAGERKGEKQASLTVEPKAEPKTEAKAEPKVPEMVESLSKSVNVAWEMLQRAEEAQRKADEAQRKAEEAAKRAEDAAKTTAEPKAEPKAEAKTEAEPKAEKPAPAKKGSDMDALGAYADMTRTNALRRLAHVIYTSTYPEKNASAELNKIVEALTAGRFPDDMKFGKATGPAHLPGQGGKYAKAYFDTLSPADQAALQAELTELFVFGEARTRSFLERMNAQQILDREIAKQFKNEQLVRESTVLRLPLDSKVQDLIAKGDLTGALKLFAGGLTGRNAKIARALAGALKGVKVQIVKDLADADGRKLAGDFDPATNTIRLDEDAGMTVHALLHEVTHAVTHSVLKNPNAAASKQLKALFDAVKGKLGTAYGTRSLEDFVAEAFSNPDFQNRLAAIRPDGKPISALRRFFNAVGNMLRGMIGLESKGTNSALDAADALIMQIVSPNAAFNGTLQESSVLGTASSVFKGLDDYIMSLPVVNTQFGSKVIDILRSGTPGTVKNIVLQSLPLHSLTEVASKELPMAPQLDTLEKQWGGSIDKRRRAAEATYKRIQNWIAGNPDKEAALNKLVAESTLAGVDPSKKRSDYLDKKGVSLIDSSGNKMADAWDAMQKEWSSLGPEGQAIYEQMRDSYAATHKELLELLVGRIDSAVGDADQKKNLKTEIYNRLGIKGRIDPYFPLMRTGDHWVSFHKGGEFYKMAFETATERDRAMKALETEKGVSNITATYPTKKRNYKDAPSTSFVNKILKVLEANKVDANVSDEIVRVFLDTLPESSFAQAFRKRMGTLGFDTNASQVFYSKSLSMAHQMANLEYGAKITKLRDEMETYVKEKNPSQQARDLFDVIDGHVRTMLSPNISSLSKALTSATFAYTLGANVSSVLVNTSQIPLVVMPILGGRYGYSQTTKAVGQAVAIFARSHGTRKATMTGTKNGETIELRSGPSIDNYDYAALEKKVKNKVALTEAEQSLLDLKELAELAEDYGLLSRSMTSDTLDMDARPNKTVLSRINDVMGFMFHHGERMNRQVALVAAYNLELGRMRKENNGKPLTEADRKAAAEEAVRLTELSNGGASANSAPLLAKNSIGKMAFMYKRYGVSMYYMLFKTTADALSAQDPMVRAAAKRQIAGIYASSALLAGVQGIPMFGVVATLYNLFLRGDDEDDFETSARKYLGEGMFSGAVNALTGLEVSSRIGLSDLIVRDTGYREQENMLLAMLQAIGGPVYGTADRIQRGVKLITEGETQRGLEQIAPAALANLMKSYRFGTEGALTMRGDPVVEDIHPGHIAAQALGLAPAEYIRQQEINASLKKADKAANEQRTKLLDRYFVAMRQGDNVADIMDDMMKFNERHPGLTISLDTINRSIKERLRRSATMYHGIDISKGMRAELMTSAAEYDNGISLFGEE